MLMLEPSVAVFWRGSLSEVFQLNPKCYSALRGSLFGVVGFANQPFRRRNRFGTARGAARGLTPTESGSSQACRPALLPYPLNVVTACLCEACLTLSRLARAEARFAQGAVSLWSQLSALLIRRVYIIIVSGKIARPALPLFVPLHSTCGICRPPYHIFPNSYYSVPRMSQIEKKVETVDAALEESPPDRFESVYLSATY
jgi:hypothetical protein